MTTPAICPPDEDLARLLLIRSFEESVLELFAQGELSGTTHTCLGQEYIPVALAPLLGADDFILSNHRGHGHYLARFDDPVGLLAEIMGRKGGVCHGVGGSQHIHRDGYLSTGVQGESLPVAAGIALHRKQTGSRGLVAAFIGDGTWGQGAVYETLNIAALWSLPVLVIVENNGIAQSTPVDRHLAGTIADRAAAFGIGHRLLRGCDVGMIREELASLAGRVREGHPLVVEFDTVRVGPHSKGDDTRDAAALADVRARDWYQLYRRAFPERFAVAERAQRGRMAAVVDLVRGWEPSDGGPEA
ncbi:thiamine pyrophosphate-dependent dehydrogenase E1 component subunit alpha [Streptomyces sp. NPDC050287]|uniref:thiamine pyrophosphate-dependent dehydrogenase E1 component subunit alpha n=1 Tax=Streptomyces sp. NPDC050287 TaxID=3365608 RepID=UPI00378791CB